MMEYGEQFSYVSDGGSSTFPRGEEVAKKSSLSLFLLSLSYISCMEEDELIVKRGIY